MEEVNITLIIIDGLEGSGKSTQAQYLVKHLEFQRKTVCLRVHPEQDNFFGIKARQFLYSRGRNAHFAAALFYMIDVIRSILLYSWQSEDYKIFVRYLMGTAYLPTPLHKIAYHFFTIIVPKTKIKFFLDVDPKEALARICASRQKQEMFEDINDLIKVRDKALSLACSNNWIIINSNETTTEVSATIRQKLHIS